MRVQRSTSLLLIALGVITVLAAHTPAFAGESVLAGVWEGAIDVAGQELGVVFRFTESDGALKGSGDIPAQNAFNIAVRDIVVEENRVRFSYADIPASFDGQFSADTDSITGLLTQGPASFPFTLVRQAPAAIDESELVALRTIIEETLARFHVAGAAVSIVKDGQVILAEGFGLRDVEKALPVTDETLFGLASATKAFTAATFQSLVEAGALSWDTPVHTVLPHLRLYDRWVTDHITARDFALHRSGLPRHDIPWMFNLDLDLDALLAAADTLQPSAPFRTTWQYNNLGYAILGLMIERATNTSWEEAVTTRLLAPLGMTATNFSVDEMIQSGDYAKTYAYNEAEYRPIPLQDLRAVKAAGALNSNAKDMAQWLLFQINQGRVGETELISAAGMREMHTAQMPMPALAESSEIRYNGYGLGWFTDDYRGYRRVHHGGNTVGFSTDVAVLPDDGIGVAVLTNAPNSPAPTIIIYQVLDSLLGLDPIDWVGLIEMQTEAQASSMESTLASAPRRLETAPSHALDEYTGIFTHPAYGDVVIKREGESLTAVYYTTTIPLEHWHYDQFRGPLNELFPISIPFLFVTDERGEISEVAIGFELAVSPIVFTRKADSRLLDPAFLATLAGEYDFAGLPSTLSVRGTTLVLTVAGQTITFEPASGLRFQMTDTPVVTIEFEIDEATGSVVKAIYTQPTAVVEMLPMR